MSGNSPNHLLTQITTTPASESQRGLSTVGLRFRFDVLLFCEQLNPFPPFVGDADAVEGPAAERWPKLACHLEQSKRQTRRLLLAGPRLSECKYFSDEGAGLNPGWSGVVFRFSVHRPGVRSLRLIDLIITGSVLGAKMNAFVGWGGGRESLF